MANPKYKWKVEKAPTGPHRGFANRGWPSAFYKNAGENLCATIECSDDYTPYRAKHGGHAPLTLRIADYSSRAKSFHWIKLNAKCATLADIKQQLEDYLESNPRIMPLDLREGHEDAIVDAQAPVMQ